MGRISFIRPGEIVPLGLSRYEQGYRLRFPIFAWVRRGYLIAQDQFAHGLWRLDVCAGTDASGVFLRWSWVFVRGTVEEIA
jgi:hypothetical protein